MDNQKQFKAVTLLSGGEGEVDVTYFNKDMAVCTEDYPVLITKEQAAAFFGFHKLIEQNKMLREAVSLVVDKIPMNQNIYGGGYMLLLSHDDCRILRETLNISELN